MLSVSKIPSHPSASLSLARESWSLLFPTVGLSLAGGPPAEVAASSMGALQGSCLVKGSESGATGKCRTAPSQRTAGSFHASRACASGRELVTSAECFLVSLLTGRLQNLL